MLYGHLSGSDAYAHLLANPAWKLAFDWLKQASAATPAGIQQIQGDELYVNVHGYDTVSAEKGRFESHRRYVDLQYCISGGEVIDWWLASELQPDGGYDEGKDVLFYRDPASCLPVNLRTDASASSASGSPATALGMSPGSFAIFHPSDAHRPKMRDGVNPGVFKLVIKLDRRLIG